MLKSASLLLILLASSFPLAAQEKEPPLVTVVGQAEVMVVPDEAVFNLRAVTLDKDLIAAQKKNDEVVRKVLALAKDYRIPPEMAQTDHISLEERYSDEEATRKPSVFLGYAVTKRISIVLRDVSKAESLLADIFKSGVTRIESVDFRTTQSRKYKDQARALAIKAAQEKASTLAREIGQSIGKAYSITEEGRIPYGGSANTTNFVGNFGGGSYSEDQSTIALGQIVISARVIVRFQLN